MRIFNFGSLNIDHVYRVDHIAAPGETIASAEYSIFAGGKGANQSVAVARAGGKVLHAGRIGHDGLWMIENMKKDGVDTSGITVVQQPTGHAIIQVDRNGQNSIVIYGGTNRTISSEDIDMVLDEGEAGDLVLIQNEINNIPYIMTRAHEAGMRVVFNPAPMGPEVFKYPLKLVSTFIINESEGEALAKKAAPEEIVAQMHTMYPDSVIILTLGSKGLFYRDAAEQFPVDGMAVTVVDSTGAGDTFIGYYLAGLQKGLPVKECLGLANRAAAISVTRKGAADSIPFFNEVRKSS